MKSTKNLKLSFEERVSLGEKIISQQPEISYQDALAQIQKLQEASQSVTKKLEARNNPL